MGGGSEANEATKRRAHYTVQVQLYSEVQLYTTLQWTYSLKQAGHVFTLSNF